MARRHVFLVLFLQLAALLLFITDSSHAQAAITEEKGGAAVGSMMMMRALGSRPPSCEGRCGGSCGRRCEAVQVPVTPQDLLQLHRKTSPGGGRRSQSAAALLPSAYADHSNYKPVGWRCKCMPPHLP